MKKFLVLLLSAMMMFAFVACEPNTPEPTETAKAINDEAELLEAVKEEGSYYLTDDIELSEQLNITAKITLDGKGYTISRSTPTTDADPKIKSVILVGTSGVVLKNLNVSGTGVQEGWNEGEFGIKVFNSTDVVLENINVKKLNAGIQVNSSEVTIKGTITLDDNTFGGIGVDKSEGTGDYPAGKLVIAPGTDIVCNSATVPAIWLESAMKGSISGEDDLTKIERSNEQIYYITTAQKDAGFPIN